jgi:hypothetical protein
MTVKSRWGLLIGAFVALVVPISCLVLALLVENGLAPYDQTHGLLDQLGLISLSEVFLGPIGIVIAGRSGGMRSAGAWIAAFVVGVPGLAIFWFLCVATLSGALGNPF